MSENAQRKIPDKVLLAIQEVFLCNGFDEEFACFMKNYDELKECIFFIYSDNEGADFPDLFMTNLDNDFAIIEMGFSPKYYVIDVQTCIDMFKTGVANYGMDVCVELDTQVVSYLKGIFGEWNSICIPESKEKLFTYLTEAGVNYSSLPYLIENSKKICKDNFKEYYLNLLCYERFKRFDFNAYYQEGITRFEIDQSNIMINTDNAFKAFTSAEFIRQMQDFFDLQDYSYCLLMKAILIELSYTKKSAENKMRMLIDFVNAEMGLFAEREMIVCYFYFCHDSRTNRFFKKVKLNSKNVLTTIKGMAWDLTHARMLERAYSFVIDDKVKLGIHPILTYDNGLKDILMLCPIKKIAIYDGFVIPYFKQQFHQIFPESKEILFSEEMTVKRKKVFATKKIKDLIVKLEEEITALYRHNNS